MTAKCCPLDFIINDSTARGDKQKAREYSVAHATCRCAPNMTAEHWGHISGVNWRIRHKRNSYLNTSFLITPWKKREERRGKESLEKT